MRSRTFTFGGANIKGTPSMKAAFVRNDVRKISKIVDVFVTQETKWRWYWVSIQSLLSVLWASSPSFLKGVAQPIFGGQGVFWKRRLFRRVGTKVLEAFDFSLDNAGVMDNRWIRAVLLECKKSMLQSWFVTMHAVVGGDNKGDSERRKNFMRQNLDRLDQLLKFLTNSDAPIVFEADMNIHPGTWAYAEFMAMVHKYNGRVVGTPGVEFLVIFDHHCSTKVVVEKNYSLTPKAAGLNTDHEVRVMDFHLQR